MWPHSVCCAPGITHVSPLSLLVGQGVAYLLRSGSWPPVVYVIEEKYIGAAYGMMTAGMNTGFAIFPLVSAYIYPNSNSYLPWVEIFYAALAVRTLVGLGLLIEGGVRLAAVCAGRGRGRAPGWRRCLARAAHGMAFGPGHWSIVQS